MPDSSSHSNFTKKKGRCLLKKFREHKFVGTGQLSVPEAGGKLPVVGHCMRLGTSMLEPNASWDRSSKIVPSLRVTDASVTEVRLLAYDPDGIQLLTYLNAGRTHLQLKKKKVGSMSFQAKKPKQSSWRAWLDVWSPHLKNIYTVELQSYDPDEDVEKISRSNSTLHYQAFGLVMSIPDKHAVQEIEIGKEFQIIFLFARVGGFMSVLSAILGFCWVRKHPYDPMVVTYEERTLLCTSEPRTQSQK